MGAAAAKPKTFMERLWEKHPTVDTEAKRVAVLQSAMTADRKAVVDEPRACKIDLTDLISSLAKGVSFASIEAKRRHGKSTTLHCLALTLRSLDPSAKIALWTPGTVPSWMSELQKTHSVEFVSGPVGSARDLTKYDAVLCDEIGFMPPKMRGHAATAAIDYGVLVVSTSTPSLN